MKLKRIITLKRGSKKSIYLLHDSPLAETPATEEAVPATTETDYTFDETLAALFDPVTVRVLEKMFPTDDQWKGWAERAKRNGLVACREGRGKFNPYKAANWFLQRNVPDWDLARCNRVLANNLPARSRDEAHLLTGQLN